MGRAHKVFTWKVSLSLLFYVSVSVHGREGNSNSHSLSNICVVRVTFFLLVLCSCVQSVFV